ncbi:MAG: hypothetical protein ACJ741_11865 [Pyrinomonadaceae bacterium]
MSSRNITGDYLLGKIEDYLLGKLTTDEQEQMEERFLLDSNFFEQAMIIEYELIDAYVDGSLSEKESFVGHFLSTPQQRRKLRTAMALRKYISELDHEELSKEANYEKPKSWLRRLLIELRIPISPAGAG